MLCLTMKRMKIKKSNRPINKEKSTNPLVHLTYRQLQSLATKLNLPANVRYKLLLALIIARTTKREDIVDAIVNDVTKKKNNPREYKQSYIETQIQDLQPIISSGVEVNFSQDSTVSMASTVTCWSEESGFSEIENCYIIPPITENLSSSVENEMVSSFSDSDNTQNEFSDLLQYCSYEF